MGNTVSDMVKKFDGYEQKENSAKEALEMMHQMAQDHLERFYEQIESDSHDAKLIPIKRVLNHYQYVQCVSKDKENISNGITDAVSDFSTGSMAEGLGNLAASIIHRLLGASSGMRKIETKYAISIDPLGGISRLDTLFFVYNFESEGLTKVTKSVVAVCVVKSSADTSAIDDNTLRVLINESFESSEIDIRKAIYAEIREVLFGGQDYTASLEAVKKSQSKALLEWSTGTSRKANALSNFQKKKGEVEQEEVEV